MNLLPQNIVEYLLAKEEIPEGSTSFDLYMEGVNSIYVELIKIYLPTSELNPNEINLLDDMGEAQIQEITSKIISALPENSKKNFDNKLSELVDKYNEAFVQDAMGKMTPQELQGYLKLLEAEGRAIDEFERKLSANSTSAASPQPQTPQPQRPAPTISLAPKD